MLDMRKICTALVKSIVVGGFVAGSMTLSGGAANADASPNWDAVAQCESGGNWHANTGNGEYGGLQFKPATWSRYGGVGNPAAASREQQIAVANRVLADQGLDAWPKCGTASGLPTAVWSKPGRGVSTIINQIIQAAVPRR
jgi:resuscitation-promoting factor RpfC